MWVGQSSGPLKYHLEAMPGSLPTTADVGTYSFTLKFILWDAFGATIPTVGTSEYPVVIFVKECS